MSGEYGARTFVTVLVGLAGVLVAACSSGRIPPPNAELRVADSVSVGYGRQARSDVTGAIAVVAERDLDDQHVTRVEELLAGRAAGVQVMRTPSGFAIRIRGTQSFLGNDEPLCILDGMPVPTGGLGSALVGLSPHDIARIEVLKDAGSTAIYGSRGANGVILITSKRPR